MRLRERLRGSTGIRLLTVSLFVLLMIVLAGCDKSQMITAGIDEVLQKKLGKPLVMKAL